MNQDLILHLSFPLRKQEDWEITDLSSSALWWGQEPSPPPYLPTTRTHTYPHAQHCTLSQNSGNICCRSHLMNWNCRQRFSKFPGCSNSSFSYSLLSTYPDPSPMPELGTWRSCLSLSELTAPPYQDGWVCEAWQSNKKVNLLNRTDLLNVVCGRTSLQMYRIQRVYTFFFFLEENTRSVNSG